MLVWPMYGFAMSLIRALPTLIYSVLIAYDLVCFPQFICLAMEIGTSWQEDIPSP